MLFGFVIKQKSHLNFCTVLRRIKKKPIRICNAARSTKGSLLEKTSVLCHSISTYYSQSILYYRLHERVSQWPGQLMLRLPTVEVVLPASLNREGIRGFLLTSLEIADKVQ